jgi:hypothetical protein
LWSRIFNLKFIVSLWDSSGWPSIQRTPPKLMLCNGYEPKTPVL